MDNESTREGQFFILLEFRRPTLLVGRRFAKQGMLDTDAWWDWQRQCQHSLLCSSVSKMQWSSFPTTSLFPTTRHVPCCFPGVFIWARVQLCLFCDKLSQNRYSCTDAQNGELTIHHIFNGRCWLPCDGLALSTGYAVWHNFQADCWLVGLPEK